MRGLFTNKKLAIASGQVVSGIAGGEQTLRIHSGRVWVTVEGIKHDYFLHAGDSFTAIPGRLTVVEADQDASIELRRAPALPALEGLRAALAAVTQRFAQEKTVQASLQRHRMCNDACC
jgi:hypothetical protein